MQVFWPGTNIIKSQNNAFASVPPIGSGISLSAQAEEERKAKVREKSRKRRERLRKDPFATTEREAKVLRVNKLSDICKPHGAVKSYANR